MHGEQGVKGVHKKRCIWLKLQAKDAQLFFRKQREPASRLTCAMVQINNDYYHYYYYYYYYSKL